MNSLSCFDVNNEKLRSLTQWDYDVTIIIGGAPTSPVPEIRFSNIKMKESIPVAPEVDGNTLRVVVPNEVLQFPLPIQILLFYKYETGDAKTEYRIAIPVSPAAKPAGYAYTPIEVASYKNLDDRVSALEDGSSAGGANGGAFTKSYVVQDTEPENHNVLWVDTSDDTNIPGQPGPSGRGIADVSQTAGDGTPGTVDTYTITYTDGTTSTFAVRNGTDGDDYELNDDDIQEIARQAAELVEKVMGGEEYAKMPTFEQIMLVANGQTEGVSITSEGTSDTPVMHLYGTYGDEPVVVRNVAPPVTGADAVPLGWLEEYLPEKVQIYVDEVILGGAW